VARLGFRGLRWPYVGLTSATLLIAFWFLWLDGIILTRLVLPHDAFGGDGLLYSAAARTWIAGGDPWAVEVNGVLLAAPPPSLLPFVLTAWAPEVVTRVVWPLVGFLAIAVTVRTLRLPWWCVLFPPSVFAALHGSIETVMVMCVAVGPRWIGPVLKPYAAIPLAVLGQWRQILIAGAIVALTIPILPWGFFLAHAGDIPTRLAEQADGGFSASSDPGLAVFTLIGLLALDRRVAAFALVPALWPAAAQQYGAMLLPVIHRLPITATIGVLPSTRFVIPVGLSLDGWISGTVRLSRAILERGRRRRAARP
jgi:hypothetical protein